MIVSISFFCWTKESINNESSEYGQKQGTEHNQSTCCAAHRNNLILYWWLIWQNFKGPPQSILTHSHSLFHPTTHIIILCTVQKIYNIYIYIYPHFCASIWINPSPSGTLLSTIVFYYIDFSPIFQKLFIKYIFC